MRILAVADTTENWTTRTLDAARNVDLVLALGDLYAHDVGQLVQGNPVLGVYGNHCRPGYLEQIGAVDLTKDAPAAWTEIDGIRILAVSGCVRYSNAAYHQWTQDEYADALADAPPCDWVVTHCPPREMNDHEDLAHNGIDALRDYVLLNQPAHLFHGHTYPETPMTIAGATQIHYVHGWRVLDIEAPLRG